MGVIIDKGNLITITNKCDECMFHFNSCKGKPIFANEKYKIPIEHKKLDDAVVECDQYKKIIKFRGKRIDNGEWVYGFLRAINGIVRDRYFIHNGAIQKKGFENGYEVIPESIGQFTNLYDMTRKEIYEKDILQISLYNDKDEISFTYRLVTFESGVYCLKSDDQSSVYLNFLLEIWRIPSIIAGNIFDTPELLKQ